ncbi:MAG: YHS domain-containing protein, partial [Candidatus Altiarchaeales archaeon]|nr:YHS domain-containing protein [Candidatus Altiarchaeales archaeon]
MVVDPVCGMHVEEGEDAIKITHKGEKHYFCSKHCLHKYLEQKNIKADVKLCESCVGVPWYKQKITLASAFTVLILLVSFYVPALNPLYEKIIQYFEIIWWAVLLGLFIGGLIDYFVPREYISHVLSKPEKKTVFKAIFLGFLMSACSHGILAISIQLYKKGASIPAVIAFLMASPWANMTYTLLLFSLFGYKALLIIFSAIVIALVTGLTYQILDTKKLIEDNPH